MTIQPKILQAKMTEFVTQWAQQEGYRPAPFQKAVAMQRLGRGQSIQEIIDALVAMRLKGWKL